MKRLILVSICVLQLTTAHLQGSERGLEGRQRADSAGTTYALVIGISQYAYINPLQYADDDAELFADYLVKQKVCERGNIYKLIDGDATRVNIFRQLKWVNQQLKSNDRVFIYFAGHGDVESDIEKGYFLPYDCLSNNYSATGLNLRDLEDWVNLYVKKNARVVLITDACRSGNLTGGLSGASITMSSLARGFSNVVKMVSCQPNQLSLEKQYPEGGHGVFTYHLVDALNGMADNDNDSCICLREIDLYLEKVRTETNKKQTPGVEGDKERTIVSFNQQLLQALVARKENEAATAVSYVSRYRGPGDSSWLQNPVYRQFSEHIRHLRLTGLNNDNAYAVYEDAKRQAQPEPLLRYMNLELASVLEDQAQKWLNKYLRGDLGNKAAVTLAEVRKAAENLQAVEQLIGTTDLRYIDIHVKRIFLDAYAVYTSRNRPAFDSVVLELEKASRLKPHQPWIYNLSGNFYRVLGKNAEAEAAYHEAMKLSPSWCYPWHGLAVLNRYNLKNNPAAEAAFKKAVELNPLYVPGWNELGKFYWSLGRFPEAEFAFRNAVQADSLHFPDVWLDLGNLYFDQKKYSEAENAYKTAIRIDPAYAMPWNNMGNTFLAMGRIPEAEKAFQKAIELMPGYADPYYSLGSLKLRAGDTEKAFALLENAFKNGFIQFEFLDADPDWNPVRDTDTFKELMKKYRK